MRRRTQLPIRVLNGPVEIESAFELIDQPRVQWNKSEFKEATDYEKPHDHHNKGS
jgi:hypothetical protein